MSKDPLDMHWFPLYVHRFLSGTVGFNAEEIGAYILLIIYQWDKGFVPNDPEEISDIARVRFEKIPRVMKKFSLKGNKLRNKRVEKVRAEQNEKHITASNKGKSGAKKRWHGHSTGIAQPSAGNGNKNREETDKKREESENAHAPGDEQKEKTFSDKLSDHTQEGSGGEENAAKHEAKTPAVDTTRRTWPEHLLILLDSPRALEEKRMHLSRRCSMMGWPAPSEQQLKQILELAVCRYRDKYPSGDSYKLFLQSMGWYIDDLKKWPQAQNNGANTGNSEVYPTVPKKKADLTG